MLGFLFKSWLMTTVSSSALKKQQKECDRLIAEHYCQIDKQVQIFIEVIEEYTGQIKNVDVDQCIVNFLVDNPYGYNLEDVNYIIIALFQYYPENAKHIKKLLNEIIIGE